MPAVILHGFNILEQTGVTFTVTGALSTKPKERLHDRDPGVQYEDSSNSGDRIFKYDQGSNAYSIQSCIVAAGHNLNSATVRFESSTDDFAAVTTLRAGPTVVSGTGIILMKSVSAFTDRYGRLKVSSAPAAPIMTELFFSHFVTMPRLVSEPGTRHGKEPGIVVHESPSGHEWGAKKHAPKFKAEYLVRDIAQADRTNLETLYDEIDGGAKFLFIEDADGVSRYVRWLNPEVLFQAVPVYSHDLVFSFREAF